MRYLLFVFEGMPYQARHDSPSSRHCERSVAIYYKQKNSGGLFPAVKIFAVFYRMVGIYYSFGGAFAFTIFSGAIPNTAKNTS